MTNDKAFPFHPFLQTRDGKKKFFPKIIGGCEAPGLRMIVTEKSTRFEVFEEKGDEDSESWNPTPKGDCIPSITLQVIGFKAIIEVEI